MMQEFNGRADGFLRHEAAGGIVLLVAAVLALVLSNSPLAWTYDALLHTPVSVRIGVLSMGNRTPSGKEIFLRWFDGLIH